MYRVTDSGILKSVESWCVTIPLYDNDKQPFDKQTVDSILEGILLNYPGFTITNSVGYWKGADKTYDDESYQVLIDAVPDSQHDSSRFFAALKQDLQVRLRQEKIYITKQDSKQELLSFAEFFEEIGVQAETNNLREEACQLAKQMVNSLGFVLQRLGYETTVLRRDSERKKVIWERKLCGIKIRSELDDDFPSEVKIIAVDQISEIGDALLAPQPFAIIGTYEFQFYVLDKSNYRSLVEVDEEKIQDVTKTKYLSPYGEPLTVKRFIEEFTMSVFTNWVVLRDEGFLPKDIKLSVGSDGSLQHAANEAGGILLHCPASIPEEATQKEIIRCLAAAIKLYEANATDTIAVMQAKAKNNYILKRAFVRRSLKHKGTN